MLDHEKKILDALQAACRCLQSIERNESAILEAIRKSDPKMAGAAYCDFAAWKRQLRKSQEALDALNAAAAGAA